MQVLVELIVNGLAVGSIYAVVAFGFVVVYKASNVFNFAHGALGAAGALMLASLVTDGGLGVVALRGANPLTGSAATLWGWTANLVLAMILAAVLGAVVERLAVRPMLGRQQFAITMATIGAAIFLQMFVDRAPIARTLRIPWGSQSWEVAGAQITKSAVASVLMGVVAYVGLELFYRTRLGLAARAVASDREAAVAQGIDLGRVLTITWALAAALATVAAVAFSFSPRGNGTIATAATPGLFFRALPVIALGGWDSYRGAYIGGLVIGLIQVAAGRYLSSYTDQLGAGYPTILPYVAMIVVLVIRPTGVFGQRPIRRV